jgi:hypothetical protein
MIFLSTFLSCRGSIRSTLRPFGPEPFGPELKAEGLKAEGLKAEGLKAEGLSTGYRILVQWA